MLTFFQIRNAVWNVTGFKIYFNIKFVSLLHCNTGWEETTCISALRINTTYGTQPSRRSYQVLLLDKAILGQDKSAFLRLLGKRDITASWKQLHTLRIFLFTGIIVSRTLLPRAILDSLGCPKMWFHEEGEEFKLRQPCYIQLIL